MNDRDCQFEANEKDGKQNESTDQHFDHDLTLVIRGTHRLFSFSKVAEHSAWPLRLAE